MDTVRFNTESAKQKTPLSRSVVLDSIDTQGINPTDESTVIINPGHVRVVNSNLTKNIVIDHVSVTSGCIVSLPDIPGYLVYNLESEMTLSDIPIHDMFPRELTTEERPDFNKVATQIIRQVQKTIETRITQALKKALAISDESFNQLEAYSTHPNALTSDKVIIANPHSNKNNFLSALFLSPFMNYSEIFTKEIPLAKTTQKEHYRLVFDTEKNILTVCNRDNQVTQHISI